MPLNSVVSIFLLVIFLTGTTGISFYIHTCSESHKRDVFAFPELLKPHSDCCTEDAVSPVAGSCNHPIGISAACCKNEHLYLKAAFTSEPVSQPATPHFSVENDLTLFSGINIPQARETVHGDLIMSGNSPPIAGKLLVLRIHQIRIPSPASLS